MTLLNRYQRRRKNRTWTLLLLSENVLLAKIFENGFVCFVNKSVENMLPNQQRIPH